MDTLPKIKICVAYELDGKQIDYMPSSSAELARVKPVYEEMDGWLCETSNITKIEDLPPKAKAYVDRLMELSGAKLGILSIGPARESTLRIAL
jgi:adenylosuccinate synthase